MDQWVSVIVVLQETRVDESFHSKEGGSRMVSLFRESLSIPIVLPKAIALQRARTHETLRRLAAAMLVTLGVALYTAGTAWDMQWHRYLDTVRFFTPPHLLMLGSSILIGLVSLALILFDSRYATHETIVNRSNSSRILGIFTAPAGFAVSGFGAAIAIVAFLLDDYSHATIWSPLSIMLTSGIVMAGTGAAYAIASEANRLQAGRLKTFCQASLAGTLSITTGALLLFIVQAAAGDGFIQTGTSPLLLYPLLLAFVVPLALLPSALVIRQPGAATIVALVYMALRTALIWFLPWAMQSNMDMAHHSAESLIPLVPFTYPITLLPAALAIDLVFVIVQQRHLAQTTILTGTGITAGILCAIFDKPWDILLSQHVYIDTTAALLATLPFTLPSAAMGAGLALLLTMGLVSIRH